MADKDIVLLPEFQDSLGNTVKPGDYIVYGRATSRACTTALAKVVEIREAPERWSSIRKVFQLSVLTYVYGDVKRVTLNESARRCIKYDEKLLSEKILAAVEKYEMEAAKR